MVRPQVSAKLLFLIALFVAPALRAAEGALEINQDCVAAGCFAGDAGGFPVTISAGGTYELTSDLVVTGFIGGIDVTADATNVVIDFAGHSMDGGGRCTGTPVTSCVAGSPANGIDFRTAVGTALVVRAGTIRGFDIAMVTLIHPAPGTTIEDMVISESTSTLFNALVLGFSGTDVAFVNVRRTKLLRNAIGGLQTDSEVKIAVEDLIVEGNGTQGAPAVRLQGPGSVVRSRFFDNAGLALSCAICGLGDNVFLNNSGGDANPQFSLVLRDMGGNVCGDGSCP